MREGRTQHHSVMSSLVIPFQASIYPIGSVAVLGFYLWQFIDALEEEAGTASSAVVLEVHAATVLSRYNLADLGVNAGALRDNPGARKS